MFFLLWLVVKSCLVKRVSFMMSESFQSFCCCSVLTLSLCEKTMRVSSFISADMQQLETHMKNRKQREQEARDPMIGQLQQMVDTFQSSTDQLANNITATVRAEVQHQMQMMVGKYVS